MKEDEIAYLRLINQKLTGDGDYSPREIAGWMGALQAQDYNMVKWAFGIRMNNATKETIDNAIDNSDIIRTHLLRPTWHFVASENLIWLLNLTAPRIKPTLKYRQDSLDLDLPVLERSNGIISAALKGGKHLTRQEIVSALELEGVLLGDNRASHLLLWAELSGIVCSGRHSGNKPTYALIEELVRGDNKISREQSLELLTVKYFTSHGPATVKDYGWWSGLTSTDIKTGMRLAEDKLKKFSDGSKDLWMGKNSDLAGKVKPVLLLPAYDEYLISYTDRSAVMTKVNHIKAVSDNGVFRPVVLIEGQVAGIWRPSANKDKIIAEVMLFGKVPRSRKAGIEEAASEYGNFIGKKAEVKYTDK
ncbi:MAG TPA: winged helix DNA-binding domain-containing protein [Bacteroidales bacterium]|nr:winged helix DNA-binding domain-containing protein [Bacteroidales bacterium]